jgi:hypothetical protein
MKKHAWMAVAAGGALCAALALAGCAAGGSQSAGSSSGSSSSEATHTATLHRGYAGAHGDKCFTEVVVATADDGTILAANVDDYQFMAKDTAGITPVPNSDKGFASGIADGNVLIDKYGNSAVYSNAMAAKGGSTQEWAVSMKAIEEYAVGKKPADLEKTSGADAVAGATLVDTANYLKAIATVAGADDLTTQGTYTGDGSDLSMGHALAAAHGDKAFASAVSLVQNGTIVASSIDDFQFMAKDTAGITPVPNSDAGFGQGYASGMVLCSKSVNSDVYSQTMKSKGNATQPWLTSMQAIESYVAGKTPSQLGSSVGVDAVSGATLADTAGYIQAAVSAAKAA